jgi:site-specific recombinase XerD
VSIRKPYHQLTVGGVEKLMKSIGARADVDKVMPHKMRHTLATNALAHGMPVTDLQKLLGHSKLETTMIYAEVSQDEVSQAHKRYVV